QAIDQAKSTAVDLAIKFGPKVLVAVIVLLSGWFVARWIGNVMDRVFRKLHLEPPVRQLLIRILRVLVLGLFLIMALQNLGIELLPLIAGIGLAGAGIALAMQGVLSNIVAGLTIIFTRPFRVGEYISIVGVEGRVENISLFTSTLSHSDLSRIVIPNRKIVGEILHNYADVRQLNIVVGVAYDTDLGQAIAAIHEILTLNAHVLKDPAPVIQVIMLADSSVNIGVKPWVAVPDYGAAGGEINRAIVETFRGRGIVIPFPQREVRMLTAVSG
ncbi:MAG: mechanosensitive ion channel domain-containing protein, partial [Betaproteobacteria bacterium]